MSAKISVRLSDAELSALDMLPGATRKEKLTTAIMRQQASATIAAAVAAEIRKATEPVARMHDDVRQLLGDIARLRARVDDFSERAAAATRAAGEMSAQLGKRIEERDEKLRAVIQAIRMSLARIEAASGISARA